jgi:hypothetical protein
MELLGDWDRVQRIRHEFQDIFAARIPQARNWTADGADIMAIVLERERITLNLTDPSRPMFNDLEVS